MEVIALEQMRPAQLRRVIGRLVPLGRLLEQGGYGHLKRFRCPWHDDRNPSASLFETKEQDGTWLLKCFACDRTFNSFDYLRDIAQIDPLAYVRARIHPAYIAEQENAAEVEAGVAHDHDPILARSIEALADQHFGGGGAVEGFLDRVYTEASNDMAPVATGTGSAEMLDRWTAFYQACPKLRSLDPERHPALLANEEYLCFRNHIGPPVAHVRIGAMLDRHTGLVPLDDGYIRWGQHPEHHCYWLIPMTTPSGYIVGFGLRGLAKADGTHKYHVVNVTGRPLPLFGLHSLAGITRDEPLILVEGAKDACALYGYGARRVVALGVAKVHDWIGPMIAPLTDRVILALDNDPAGEKGCRLGRYILVPHGPQAVRMRPPDGVKDWGQCVMHEQYTGTVKYLLRHVAGVQV